MAAAINAAEARSLPAEIIFDILSRLPARSILKIRCVCKLWLSTTHHPHFINAHLRRARNHSNSILLFFPYHSEGRHRITIIDSKSPPSTQLLSQPKHHDGSVFVNESCNGLICISGDNGSIDVVNPATGESLIPPKPTSIPSDEFQSVYFGFHPKSGDYKIIRFFGQKCGVVRGCEVYTLGTASWRQLQGTSHYFPKNWPAAVDGTIYWVVKKYVEGADPHLAFTMETLLLAFDTGDEKFTTISLPDYTTFNPGEIVSFSVMELQGVPVVIAQPQTHLDVWMFDTESTGAVKWTQKYRIMLSAKDSLPIPLLICNEKVLVQRMKWRPSMENGEELLLVYHHVHKEDGSEEVVCHDYHDYIDFQFGAFVHVESLVQLRNFKSDAAEETIIQI